VSEIDL